MALRGSRCVGAVLRATLHVWPHLAGRPLAPATASRESDPRTEDRGVQASKDTLLQAPPAQVDMGRRGDEADPAARRSDFGAAAEKCAGAL